MYLDIHIPEGEVYSLVARVKDPESSYTYVYYIKPWTEKVKFFANAHFAYLHENGKIQDFTISHSKGNDWKLRSFRIYTSQNTTHEKKDRKNDSFGNNF